MKRLLVISGVVIGVLLLVIIAVPLFINVDNFRPDLEKKLSAALNRQVHIGKLDASLLSGGASASDITIADDPAFNKDPFLKAASVKVGVQLMPLIFSKQLKVTSLTIQKPDITLLKNAAGKWNYSTLGATAQTQKTPPEPPAKTTPESSGKPAPEPSGKSAPDVSVDKFEIAGGTVRVGHSSGHSAGKESVYQNVNLVAHNISAHSAMPFTLSAGMPGGGSMNLEGQAGPLNPADSAKSPLDAKLTLKHADLGATGFVDPSSGVGGVLDFDGQVKSDGHKLHSEGKAKAADLRVVKGGQPAKQPIALDYKSDYALDSDTGTINANLHTGNSLTNASGTLSAKGEDTLANLKIVGKNMAVNDVEGLLPAFGVVLPSGASLQGGNINMDLNATGPLDRLVIDGPLKIEGTHLSGYNLGSKLGAIAAFTGNKSSTDTLIQTFSSALRVAPEGIKADNIVLDVPSLGTVTGNGVIAGDNSLDFKMLIKLAGTANNLLGSLTGGSASAQSKGLPFLIQGKTSNPVFRPALGSAVTGDLQNSLLNAVQGNKGNKTDQQNQQKPDLKDALGGLFNKKKKPQQ
ncbi:MAG TPA: AsmA family protein [Candidatus Polarisedimenticolia bacterium]|nr:AsmA family protein [Candidatus Polarisedimenticolia bacterium]